MAEQLGFLDTAEEIYSASPVPDYDATGDGSYLGGFLSLMVGVAITAVLGLGAGYLVKKNAP